MSIVDDLVENLVERNAIDVNGTFTVSLIDGGLRVRGSVRSTLRDQRKNKQLLAADIPVDAQLSVGALVIPVPQIK